MPVDDRVNAIQKIKNMVAFLEAHPEVGLPVQLATLDFGFFVYSIGSAAAVLSALGGAWEKRSSGEDIKFKRDDDTLGHITVWVPKSLTCKRVEKRVTVPAKPAVEEHEEVRVEWECPDSILSVIRNKASMVDA